MDTGRSPEFPDLPRLRRITRSYHNRTVMKLHLIRHAILIAALFGVWGAARNEREGAALGKGACSRRPSPRAGADGRKLPGQQQWLAPAPQSRLTGPPTVWSDPTL